MTTAQMKIDLCQKYFGQDNVDFKSSNYQKYWDEMNIWFNSKEYRMLCYDEPVEEEDSYDAGCELYHQQKNDGEL